ncbi:MAG: helix-turn-helix transcriptional regulator [Anaerolineaceae bacterium]|nr:helix-turn-helix transcriptional regulator [Anaerolineaceae bacterium]
MSDWTNLTQNFFGKPQGTPYQFDKELNQMLLSLARQENCSPNEIAAKLLLFAIGERKKIQYNSKNWQKLSPREQEVAACICMGNTNQEIALKLGISPETVKTHVRNVLGKFELRRKHDLKMELEGWDLSAWNFLK